MTRQKYVFIGVGIACVVLFGVGYQQYRFVKALDAYTLAAGGHDTAAYVPGATTNTTRRILNRLLGEILTGKHTDEERRAFAEEGLEALEVSEQEIDAIGILGENVTSALTRLESTVTLFHSSEKKELLELAHKRFEIAADIRGLSYLANHHSAEIFHRIISDGGALTAEHSVDLNNKIPEVEADCDRRAALYRDLESAAAASNRLTSELRRVW